MTKKIETQITINANPSKVWRVLTAQSDYPNWNSFILKFEGNLKVREQLEVVIQPANSSKMTFKPKVLECTENKLLKWKGKLLMNGIFDGTHQFELVDNKNGTTTFIQSEEFKGVLVRFFNLENTVKGFENMNRELKERCETLKPIG